MRAIETYMAEGAKARRDDEMRRELAQAETWNSTAAVILNILRDQGASVQTLALVGMHLSKMADMAQLAQDQLGLQRPRAQRAAEDQVSA